MLLEGNGQFIAIIIVNSLLVLLDGECVSLSITCFSSIISVCVAPASLLDTIVLVSRVSCCQLSLLFADNLGLKPFPTCDIPETVSLIHTHLAFFKKLRQQVFWNTLPQHIRKLRTIKQFKSKLKELLLMGYVS